MEISQIIEKWPENSFIQVECRVKPHLKYVPSKAAVLSATALVFFLASSSMAIVESAQSALREPRPRLLLQELGPSGEEPIRASESPSTRLPRGHLRFPSIRPTAPICPAAAILSAPAQYVVTARHPSGRPLPRLPHKIIPTIHLRGRAARSGTPRQYSGYPPGNTPRIPHDQPTVPGHRAVLRHGIAYAPEEAPLAVKKAIWAIEHDPHASRTVWGERARFFFRSPGI